MFLRCVAIRLLKVRDGVEDTRLEAEDTKKNPRPRPRTVLPKTDPLEAKDWNARGKGQGHQNVSLTTSSTPRTSSRTPPLLKVTSLLKLYKFYNCTITNLIKRHSFIQSKIIHILMPSSTIYVWLKTKRNSSQHYKNSRSGRPDATGGIPRPCPPPKWLLVPPKRKMCPLSEDCAQKTLIGSWLLECKSSLRLQIGVYRPYFRNFCGLTPDFIKLLGRRLFLWEKV